MKIYISARLVNKAFNRKVASVLESAGHVVLLPQTFCPEDTPHESYAEGVYRQCVDAMVASDVGLILLDSYGRDSSWECGWYTLSDKPLIGLVGMDTMFVRDYMVKGGMDGVIALNRDIYEQLREDTFFGADKRPLVSVDMLEQVANALERILPVARARKQDRE